MSKLKASYNVNETNKLTPSSYTMTAKEAHQILEKITTDNLVEYCKTYKEQGHMIPVLFAQVLQEVCKEQDINVDVHLIEPSLGPVYYGVLTVSTDVITDGIQIGEVFKLIRFTTNDVYVSHFNKHNSRQDLQKTYETTFQCNLYEGLLGIVTFMKSSISAVKRYQQSFNA